MDIKAKVAAQTNIVIASAAVGMTVDGQAIYPYDTIFLAGQTAAAENGPYTMQPSGKLLRTLASFDGTTTIEIAGGTFAGYRYQYNGTTVAGESKFTETTLIAGKLLTYDDESVSLPNSMQLVVNQFGDSNLLLNALGDNTVSIDAVFGKTALTYAEGADIRFTQINRAGAPTVPIDSSHSGWILRVSATGTLSAYGLYPPSSVLSEDSDTFRRRIIQTDSTGKIFGYDNAYRFTGQTGTLHTITIAESEWGGDGAVYPADGNHNHVATVEVTIVSAQQDLISKRQVHEAIIYKLGTGTSWAVGYDGGERNTALDIPSGFTQYTDPYVSFNLTLNGTHNGTLNLGIEPTGEADPKSDILVFVKVRGGGRTAA